MTESKQDKIRAQTRARVAALRERKKQQYDSEFRAWVTAEECDKLTAYLKRLRKKAES